MAKNIVFCADGTWNGPGEAETDPKKLAWTNVFKLFLNLDGKDSPDSTRFANEQERELSVGGQVVQVAKYLHGVGDSDNFLVKALGGGVGSGLIARIVRGYTFVSRNYQPGDKIFLIGFSRGAYTARALAGMIAARGLLDQAKRDNPDDKDAAYRDGSKVWYDYRQQALAAQPGRLKRLTELALDLPHFLSRERPIALVAADIDTVAVWDTVGSLGIPDFDNNADTDAFQFADRKLSAKVRNARHAISIDEQRSSFAPTLWDRDARIVQVLFPGAHADVGGGYLTTESGLSDGALRWMTAELTKLGVRFAAEPALKLTYDPFADAHAPWLEAAWRHFGTGPRAFPNAPDLWIAQTVLDRIAHARLNYLPANIATYLKTKLAADDVIVVPI